LSDEAGVPIGCNRCGVGAFPIAAALFDGGFVIVVVVVVVEIGGGGGGGICKSGKIKSRSRKRSVICINSNVKPRSSAYLDKNSYEENLSLTFLIQLNVYFKSRYWCKFR
jgi:hypothetical protein